MELEDFLLSYPQPPKVKRSERSQITVYFTDEEMDMLRYLAYNPRLPFGDSLNGVVRWSFYHAMQRLQEVSTDQKFMPLADRLAAGMQVHNLRLNLEKMDEFVSFHALKLRTLVEHGFIDDAFKALAEVLLFVYKQPRPYNTVLSRKLYADGEVIEARNELEKSDASRLADIERNYD